MAQLFMSNTPYYKQKAKCGYCGKEMLKRNLADEHIPSHHPGLPYLEATEDMLNRMQREKEANKLVEDAERAQKQLEIRNKRRLQKLEERAAELMKQKNEILKKREEDAELQKIEEQRKKEKREKDRLDREEQKRKKEEQDKQSHEKLQQEQKEAQKKEQRRRKQDIQPKSRHGFDDIRPTHSMCMNSWTESGKMSEAVDGSTRSDPAPKNSSFIEREGTSVSTDTLRTASDLWKEARNEAARPFMASGSLMQQNLTPSSSNQKVKSNRSVEPAEQDEETRNDNRKRKREVELPWIPPSILAVPNLRHESQTKKLHGNGARTQQTVNQGKNISSSTLPASPSEKETIANPDLSKVTALTQQDKTGNGTATSSHMDSMTSKPGKQCVVNDDGSIMDNTTSVMQNPGINPVVQKSREEMKDAFKNSQTVPELLRNAPCFVFSEDTGKIECVPCKSQLGYKPMFFNPSDDAPDSLQKRKFYDLKKKMIYHMYQSNCHDVSSKIEKRREETLDETQEKTPEENEEEKESAADPNCTAGMPVLRSIYSSVKNGRGYKSVEGNLSEKQADGTNVGNINHGRNFAGSMASPFYEAVKQTVVNSLSEPLPATGLPAPFAIVADKCTPARTTLETIGIITPRKNTGELHAILLDVKPAENLGGAGTAKELVTTIKDFASDDLIQSSLVGVAVDGGYHNTNIDWHLPKALGLTEESKELFACRWDGAHLLELSGKKSRGQTGADQVIALPWFRETIDHITAVKGGYGRGKNWVKLQEENILDQCEHLQQSETHGALSTEVLPTVKKLFSNSATRFTGYNHRVLSNMNVNFRSTCLAMKASSDPLLQKITEAPFPLRLNGLEDFYGEVGKVSSRLQSTRLYSWNVKEQLDDCVNTLERMADNIREARPDPKLTNFEKAVHEISGSSTYSGIDVHPRVYGDGDSSISRDIETVREELASNMESFASDLSSRISRTTPRICLLAQDCFSLRNIEPRGATAVPTAFPELVKLHQKGGILDVNLTKETLEQEYKHFAATVLSGAEEVRAVGMTKRQKNLKMKVEEAVYSELFVSEEKTRKFRNVANLLVRSAVQSSCEAVTEGMCSVIKSTLRRRENMKDEKLCHEVFVRMNGPKATIKCDPILERAGDIRFGSRDSWRFVKSSQKAKDNESKVIARIKVDPDKFDNYAITGSFQN